MTETQKQVIAWLAHGRVGVSSKAIAMWVAFGEAPERFSHPRDPDDLNRCLLLLEVAPGLRADLGKMREVSEEWARLIDGWDEIESSFLDEAGLGWCKAMKAHRTYRLMQTAIYGEDPGDKGSRVTIRVGDKEISL